MGLSIEEKVARDFAVRAHGDQRYGVDPYVVHLDEVHDIAVEFGLPTEYRVAAFLHDTIEDTGTTVALIEAGFGIDIAQLVVTVSGFGPNRRARIADAEIKMVAHPRGVPLKLCDRIANGRACLRQQSPVKLLAMYTREYPDFRAALYKPSQRSGFDCTALWAELDRIFEAR
jgi:(p)ppGpp synthase/HD superfamily hydrolase